MLMFGGPKNHLPFCNICEEQAVEGVLAEVLLGKVPVEGRQTHFHYDRQKSMTYHCKNEHYWTWTEWIVCWCGWHYGKTIGKEIGKEIGNS